MFYCFVNYYLTAGKGVDSQQYNIPYYTICTQYVSTGACNVYQNFILCV
jgi:hypothetical protein